MGFQLCQLLPRNLMKVCIPCYFFLDSKRIIPMTRGQKQATKSRPQIIVASHSRKLYSSFSIVVVFIPGIRAGNDSVAEYQDDW